MTEMKVFEFAKEVGIETLALMDKIRQWNLPVKSHMADLDPAMMQEIRERLTAELQTAAPKKTVTRKKVVAKEKAAETPKVAKKASSAVEVKDEAAEAAPAEKKAKIAKTKAAKPASKTAGKTAKPAARATTKKAASKVIRRKAGQTAESIAEENEAAAQAAAAEEAGAAAPAVGAAEGAEEAAPARPRGNIIGRMDLSRVTSPAPASTSGASAAANLQPRPSRTAPRSLRAGFVAPNPFDVENAEFEERERREREEKAAKKRVGRETVEQTFTATEFRKREVIFSPKKKKPLNARDIKQTQITTPAAHKRVVKMHKTIKVGELANQMGVRAPELIKKLMANGVMATINMDLDFDTVALIVPEFGWEAQSIHKTVDELLKDVTFGETQAERTTRPPVVTIMGHVDHGKTTLLDAIRSANVAAGEAGGITQHIGAYKVLTETGKTITFIDTPGHEAFTAMRARGANVTDIAIIVVAADDGLMPQTAEAINHAKAANVPIIVAVNKMDKPGANPDRIKQQLTEFELVPEEWGGTTIFAPVSALKKQGISELLEQINVLAEVQDLKANPKQSGTGIVIESRLEKGRGNVATVLVKDGSVEVGDVFVAGQVMGRIRSMMDDKGARVESAGPGEPVEIIGLEATPEAGDRFDICEDEATARQIVDTRRADKLAAATQDKKISLEEIFAKAIAGEVKELAIVLKADVAGSVEAIKGMLGKIEATEAKVKIIHSAVGGITESDVLLASAARGLIIGFNVRPDGGAIRMSKEKGVEIKTYTIIYNLVDEIKLAMAGLLKPLTVEKVLGRAEVRNTFTVPKMGTIAGCFVSEGKVTRSANVRLIREGRVVYDGKVGSLKRFKDDAKEVAQGYECGLGIENYNDIKVGDIIEAYTTEEVARELT